MDSPIESKPRSRRRKPTASDAEIEAVVKAIGVVPQTKVAQALAADNLPDSRWTEVRADIANDPAAIDPMAGVDEQYRQIAGEQSPIGEAGRSNVGIGLDLDGEQARREHKKLLDWFYRERDIQSVNRLEMSIDSDFYDNRQWAEEDAAILRSRGQMPLVYNEVAPMADWLIGTERRTRVDWRVLPRTEDDVQLADVKTKVLKFVSDINRVQFARSRAFADAVKVGVGWVDDGVRDDPTQDPIYSKYEDWRNVLWDSASYELDLSDARYLFRWRWVDEDVALTWFPKRQAQIKRAAEDVNYRGDGEWEFGGARKYTGGSDESFVGARSFISDVSSSSASARRRARLIEAQYRTPAKVAVVADGPWRGAIAHPADAHLLQTLSGGAIVERTMMRVHVAVFTETDMLSWGTSIFRHNRYSLTPVWCYRDGRTRLPYGAIRRVRDIQQDVNKRASKANFLTNSNQLLIEEGATDDIEGLREEAKRPDGVLIGKKGHRFEMRRDAEQVAAQLELMRLGAVSIQKSAGVADENLGRQTNAVSGEAIKARQLQGSVVTTEPFDNLRLAVAEQGQKQLSLIEQFYSEPKVARISGAKGAIEWVKVNQPEVQPDGSVRYINDITASMADFVVSEQDYAGTMRQVMFEQLANMAQKMAPDMALRLMTIAMEFSDMPNKDQIAAEFRRLTNTPDPSKELTPEEQAQQQQAAQQQAEALELQRQTAIAALEEQRARAREINARAEKIAAESAAQLGGGDQGVQAAVDAVRRQADAEIERMAEQLRRAHARVDKVLSDNDAMLEKARIDAANRIEVEQMRQESRNTLDALMQRLERIEAAMRDEEDGDAAGGGAGKDDDGPQPTQEQSA